MQLIKLYSKLSFKSLFTILAELYALFEKNKKLFWC